MVTNLLRRSVPHAGAVAAAVGAIAGLGILASGLIGKSGSRPSSTSVATTPTAPAPSGSILDRADAVVKSLPEANIVFTAPETVRLGSSTQIQLLLSAQESIARLKKKLSELGKQEGARIRVSDRMEAHLAGLGFKVEPLTPEVQAISTLAPTEWSWDIEPTRSGTQHLTLTVSALIRVHGESTPLVVQTFEKKLTIHVTLYERVKGFVSDNWQWLWLAIGAPIASVLYTRYKRGKRARRRRAAASTKPRPSPRPPPKTEQKTEEKVGDGRSDPSL